VSYRERQRLADIQAAIDAIRSYLQRGTLADGMVFDAVRIRLLEIGEAVKALPTELLNTQPDLPWSQSGPSDLWANPCPTTPSKVLCPCKPDLSALPLRGSANLHDPEDLATLWHVKVFGITAEMVIISLLARSLC